MRRMTGDAKNKWAGPSEKGAFGFSNIMRVNNVDDAIYDVTIGNVKHAHMLQQKTVTIIFWGIGAKSIKSIKTFSTFEHWNIQNKNCKNYHKPPFHLS